MTRDNRRFQSNWGASGVYTCHKCGKKTRETGEGESSSQLCARCLRDCYWDNHHSDNCDFTGPREQCPTCKADGYNQAYVEGSK